MKTKSFTSEQVAEWVVTFYKFETEEQYQSKLHAIRCMFDADNDKEFWNEVCAKAKALLNNEK